MRVNTSLFQSFLVGHERYRPVETCGFDSFCQIIIVGVLENIVPREAIENALSNDQRELIFDVCENLALTSTFYRLRLQILLRYTQQFNSRAITLVPSVGYSFVNCNSNANFVITMLLQVVPVLRERFEACTFGHQSFTKTLANLPVSVEDIRNPDLLRVAIPNAFATVHDKQCAVRFEEGFRCQANREASLIHAGKYVLNYVLGGDK